MVLSLQEFENKYSRYNIDQMFINKNLFAHFIDDCNKIKYEIVRKSMAAKNEEADELFRAVLYSEITVDEYKTKLEAFDKQCNDWRDSQLAKLESTRTKIERSW
jgi:hypothetical protein